MPKIQANRDETHQPDERDNNSRGERENPRLYTRMGIPGNKKGRESTKQRTCINAHANMEIHIIMAHTKTSIEGIPPKNIKTDTIWKQIMSRLITRIHAIQHKDRKSENKKRSEARRILTLQYEQKSRTTGTNKRNSRLAPQDRGGTYKTEPSKTLKPANPENK